MRGPQLVYQPSVAQMQIAQAQGPMPRPAPPVVTTKTVHAPTVWRPQVTQVQQAYPYACDAAMRVSPAVSIVQPRKDVASQIRPAVAAEGHVHVATDAMNGKSWPVTYTRTTPWTGRVPTYAVPPEASGPGARPAQAALPPANRRSACVLPRPELLSAREAVPNGSTNTAPAAGLGSGPPRLEHGVPATDEAGMLIIPSVRPMNSSAPADATLLSVWPGLEDDDADFRDERSAKPQGSLPKSRGQLTTDERLAYRELQFVEHLGSGEFGQVFRGFFKGQEVAIKQLYWDNTVLPQVIIQDLTREIESFRHLRHKRLVNFIGACLEIPNLCIVTEYAPGGSLHHLLHVRKLQLPLLHCTNMCLQLAEGVVYLHSQNPIVVHRDLKSLNVVLDLSLNLKLCDFGLTESMERTHITKKNNGGSPRYMAPEFFCSRKLTGKRQAKLCMERYHPPCGR
ncbi:unnamed protein product [Symbiodinium sp. KB8]|nr:unnamed protein product [Symbiodinium sp. KB8]